MGRKRRKKRRNIPIQIILSNTASEISGKMGFKTNLKICPTKSTKSTYVRLYRNKNGIRHHTGTIRISDHMMCMEKGIVPCLSILIDDVPQDYPKTIMSFIKDEVQPFYEKIK